VVVADVVGHQDVVAAVPQAGVVDSHRGVALEVAQGVAFLAVGVEEEVEASEEEIVVGVGAALVVEVDEVFEDHNSCNWIDLLHLHSKFSLCRRATSD
jgi:hypothetical protein